MAADLVSRGLVGVIGDDEFSVAAYVSAGGSTGSICRGCDRPPARIGRMTEDHVLSGFPHSSGHNDET